MDAKYLPNADGSDISIVLRLTPDDIQRARQYSDYLNSKTYKAYNAMKNNPNSSGYAIDFVKSWLNAYY